MSDSKRHTRFIDEDISEKRPTRSSPTNRQSNLPKPVHTEEHPPSPRNRFPVKRTQEKNTGKLVPVLVGSPWKNYEIKHRLKFGYSFAIVTSTVARLPYMIRSITGPSTDEQIQRLHRLCHSNIVEILELYTCPQTGYFLVSEYLSTSLQHLYQAPIYPTEPQLSSILHQVLTGLEFLLASGLVHEQVSATNLLISAAGDVKICDVERCIQDGDISKLSTSFTKLMIKLMDKEKVGDAVAGLTRPDLWSHEAIDLFTEAISNPSVEELLQHSFMRKREQRDLVWLVQFVLMRSHHSPE